MIQYYDRVQKDFSAASSEYDKYAELQRIVARSLLDKFPIANEAKLLDLGCGTGVIAKELKTRGFKGDIMQLDISPEMCNIARKYSPAKDCNFDNFEQLLSLTQNQKYDVVVSSMALHWSKTLPELISLIRNNILKEDGQFFAAFPIDGNFPELEELQGIITLDKFPVIAENQLYDTEEFSMEFSDFISILKYLKNLGGRSKNSQNQRALKREELQKINITSLTWKIGHIRI